MVTQMAQQDVISNNLANLNTVGFKRDLALFRARSPMEIVKMQPAIPRTGAPAQVSNLGTIHLDSMVDEITAMWGQGDLKNTDNPTDLALRGDGFFLIQTPAGPAFSRNGEFHLDTQRRLVDAQNNPVLGTSGPVQLPPEGKLHISDDGTVVAGTQEVTKLRLETVADRENELQKRGDNYFIPGPGVAARPATGIEVHQGFLEMSTASPITEMVNMISALRTYEACQRAIATEDETLGRAVNDIARPV